MLYPSLLAVGGVTRDMCACIVRQDYTGAHIHAHGWTSLQRLFILCLLLTERCAKFKVTRQSQQCFFLWNFFHPLQFAITSAPSMCSLLISCFFLKKESILLLISSVISTIYHRLFFLQISTWLIRQRLDCLIHF